MADETTQDTNTTTDQTTSEQVAAAALTVTTDQADYAPGSIATFTAENVAIGGAVTFDVDHVLAGDDGVIGTADDTLANDLSGLDAFIVTDGGAGDLDNVANGAIVASWDVNQDAAGQTFVLTATDDSGAVATAGFTDSAHPGAIDLTAPASSTTLTNGTATLTDDAIFEMVTPENAGTGGYETFLLTSTGGNDGDNGIHEGFNSDAVVGQYLDVHESQTVNLAIEDLATITRGGVEYYVFRTDLNESNKDPLDLIALNKLQLYISANPATLDDYNADFAGLTPVFDLDAGADRTLLLTDDQSSGSGTDDYQFLVPKAAFGGATSGYVTMYVEWGGSPENDERDHGEIVNPADPYTDNGGFEEWAALTTDGGGGGGDPGQARLVIEKTTTDTFETGGVASMDAGNILVGHSILWTYTVTNAGDVDLENVVVHDDKIVGGITAFTVIVGDADNILEAGETWAFTATGVAEEGDYTNTAHATADRVDELGTALSNDASSSYFGANPLIEIEKRTFDGTVTDATVADAFDDASDDSTILFGETVTWIYKVSYAGNVDLTDIKVTDSEAGVTAVYLTGDDGNGLLEEGETWYYKATGLAVANAYTNTGTAEGSFEDTAGHKTTVYDYDASGYFGAKPSIDIVKVTVAGAESGDNLNIVAGASITWKYTVTNTGNVALENVVVTDNQGVTPKFDSEVSGNGDSIFDAGEVWLYTATGTAIEGHYANTGKATGDFTDTAEHTTTVCDEDGSGYQGWKSEALTQGFWGARWESWDDVASTHVNGEASLVALGTLKAADINPRGDGQVLLGDTNGNGIDDGVSENTLLISNTAAKAALSNSTTGDARLIMLQQALATQLNIWNGETQPNNLITEAVDWLKADGAWAGVGGSVQDLDKNNDGVLDAGWSVTTKGGNTTFKLAGTEVSTSASSALWSNNAIDLNSTAGNDTLVTGEGLKNALMWFNQGQLITDESGNVGWSDGVTVDHIYDNTVVDNFWNVLGAQDNELEAALLPGLKGIV